MRPTSDFPFQVSTQCCNHWALSFLNPFRGPLPTPKARHREFRGPDRSCGAERMVRNFPATDILPEQAQTGVPRKRRQRTPQAGRPPQAVRHQSRSDQPSSLITAEMSSVKTAEANRNRRQICALTPFRLASSCATISAEFGETFLPFIALPPKRAKSPYRWRGWAFRILAATQLHAAMTAIAANSF